MARLFLCLRILILSAAALAPRAPASDPENPCFCNGLAIDAGHPIRPFLSDPLGRRLGTDPKDGVFRNEMNALYTLGDPSNTTHPSLSVKREAHPAHYIHLRPMRGRYRIQAAGVDTGGYSMIITAVRGDCTQDITRRTGRTRKGRIEAFDLEYEDGSGDTLPPVTRIGYQEGTWLNKAGAVIRLTAEDACAGVALIRIKAEGGREIGPGLIEMRVEGESRLEFGSVDNAGNEETRREVKVRCDFTPPTVAHDYQGGRIASGPVEIRFRAFDRVSGQAKVHVRVRHRDEFLHTGSLLRLSEPGTYYLRYNAVDPAGNWSEMQTLELELREQPWYRRWPFRVLGRARPGDG